MGQDCHNNPASAEQQLVEQAKHDREAFGKLYELHVERIYNYIYYRTGNNLDAEDLTARVFMQAVQHIGRYEDRGAPFSAWLYRIARNMLANWYRDRSRRSVVSLESITEQQVATSPEAAAETTEAREMLLAAIRGLPADRQELLILKYVERMPNAEIGRILDRSEGAIKSLYFRTMIALRDEMAVGGEQNRERHRPQVDPAKKTR